MTKKQYTSAAQRRAYERQERQRREDTRADWLARGQVVKDRGGAWEQRSRGDRP